IHSRIPRLFDKTLNNTDKIIVAQSPEEQTEGGSILEPIHSVRSQGVGGRPFCAFWVFIRVPARCSPIDCW
ncbi:MAG: hypothetical protein K0R28_7193, partial [Paenibacillus sp.]|nr:hypothetical protein [Paenibacillus sp.]